MLLPEPLPDLRSLELLRTVAERGSIRQAALVHNISQPAASMRLHSLERVLGLELLDRSRGRAQLTPTGLAVIGWSEDVLDAMRTFLLSAAAVRSEGQTHLRVAASMTVAEYLAPVWLSRLRATDPDIVVSLQMGNSERAAEVVDQMGSDIGFVEGQSAPHGLSSRVVQADDLVLVVAPSHAWARRRVAVSPSELATTPLVLREVGSGTREVLEAALGSLGFEAIPSVAMASTTAIKAAAISGAGPAVLSRLATDSEVEDGRLAVVPTEGIPLGRSVRAVWRRDRPLTPPAKRLLRQIETHIKAERT